ncbi:hypothetical protein [Bacillus sp. AK128]
MQEVYNSKKIAAFEPGGENNESLKQFNIPIIGDFYDVQSVDLKEYRLVIMSHVLEHFYHPKQVLEKLYKETNKDILVYIAIPSLTAIKGTKDRDFLPLGITGLELSIYHIFINTI